MMIFLLSVFLGFDLNVVLFDGAGAEFNIRNRYGSIDFPLGTDLSFGRVFLKRGNLKIGTNIFYGGDYRRYGENSFVESNFIYEWHIYRGESSFFPLYLGFTTNETKNYDVEFSLTFSDWGRGREDTIKNQTGNRIIYILYTYADRFLNLSAGLNFKFAKGFNVAIEGGLDFTHYKKLEYPPTIRSNLPEDLTGWNLEPILRIRGSFPLIDIKREKVKLKSSIQKNALILHAITGLLEGSISTLFTVNSRIPEGWNDFEAGSVTMISGVVSGALSGYLYENSLKFGRENDIMDYVTLGTTCGMLAGFINGAAIGAVSDQWAEGSQFSSFESQNMFSTGIFGAVIGGCVGFVNGYAVYLLSGKQ